MDDALTLMPPWDASPYFQTITEGSVTIPAATIIQLVPADPMRVALIVDAAASTGSATLTLNGKAGGKTGLFIASSRPIIELYYSEVGPLVQQQWFASGALNTIVTYYAISLAKWPTPPATRRKRGKYVDLAAAGDSAGNGG